MDTTNPQAPAQWPPDDGKPGWYFDTDNRLRWRDPPVTQPPAPTTVDLINHPPHYTFGGIEVIDAVEAWGLGYHLGNVVKYVVRADHKGDPIADLKKARWYLDRRIRQMELAQ